MRRVRRVYLLKRLLSGAALRLYVLGISALAAAPFISPGNIVYNSTRSLDPATLGRFLTEAFLGTEFVVQCALVAALLASVWMVRDLVRSIEQMAGRLRRPA